MTSNRWLILSSIFVANLVLQIDGSSLDDDFGYLAEILATGKMTGKSMLFVGEELKLTCNLNNEHLQKNLTADSLVFVKTTPLEARNTLTCMSQDLVHVVNKTSASLIVPNIQVNNTGLYHCRAGKLPCKEDDESFELIAYSEDIKIEYPPQKVVDFRCLLYNWDAKLECLWKHPQPYVDESDINVTAKYSANPSDPKVYPCPRLTPDWCIWDEFSGSNLIIVEVNVTNRDRNVTASDVFTEHVFQLVKPYPVDDLSAEASDEEGCVLLSWTHKKIYKDKIYRIKHRSEGDIEFEVIKDSWKETNFITCGYGPMSRHEFAVEVFPSGLHYSGYWSDPAFVGILTPQTAPSLGPEIVNGSFESTECKNGRRTVIIFWQGVQDKAKNGIIDKYMMKTKDKNITIMADIYKGIVKDISCTTSTRVEILAHNDGGWSLKSSVIVIPPLSFTVPETVLDSFVVEIENSKQLDNETEESLLVQWKQETDENLGYTIFWCWRSSETCEGEIHWLQVPQSQGNQSIPLPSLSASHYQYGISARNETNGKASAIKWTSCLYSRDSELPAPSKFDVTPEPEGMTVTWETQKCTYKKQAKIESYIIKWCEAYDCEEDKIQTRKVSAKVSHLKQSGLKAERRYNVTIQSMAGDIAGQEVIPWKTVVPIETEGKTATIIIISATVGVCFALVIAFMIWRRCRKSKKNMLDIAKNSDQLAPPWSKVLQTESPAVPSTRPDVMPHNNPHVQLSMEVSVSQESTSGQSLADSVWDSGACLIPPTSPGKTKRGEIQSVKVSSNLPTQPGVSIPMEDISPQLSPTAADRLLPHNKQEKTTTFGDVERKQRVDSYSRVQSGEPTIGPLSYPDSTQLNQSLSKLHVTGEESSHKDSESMDSYILVGNAKLGVPQVNEVKLKNTQSVDLDTADHTMIGNTDSTVLHLSDSPCKRKKSAKTSESESSNSASDSDDCKEYVSLAVKSSESVTLSDPEGPCVLGHETSLLTTQGTRSIAPPINSTSPIEQRRQDEHTERLTPQPHSSTTQPKTAENDKLAGYVRHTIRTQNQL